MQSPTVGCSQKVNAWQAILYVALWNCDNLRLFLLWLVYWHLTFCATRNIPQLMNVSPLSSFFTLSFSLQTKLNVRLKKKSQWINHSFKWFAWSKSCMKLFHNVISVFSWLECTSSEVSEQKENDREREAETKESYFQENSYAVIHNVIMFLHQE